MKPNKSEYISKHGAAEGDMRTEFINQDHSGTGWESPWLNKRESLSKNTSSQSKKKKAKRQ